MTRVQLEAWVLSIVDRARQRHSNEDSRVELKSELPEAHKAARRLAGHANAAHGAPVLWVIGLNERTGEAVPKSPDLADWLPQLQAHFDGIAPAVTDLIVPVEGGAVIALLFQTDRAPYVVKNSVNGGPVTLEVPWREGTRVRSATRADLIRILAPYTAVPGLELIYGTCSAEREHCGPGQQDYHLAWSLELGVYIEPSGTGTLALPRHKCHISIKVPDVPAPARVLSIRLGPPQQLGMDLLPFHHHPEDYARPSSLTIRASLNEALVDGPGLLVINGTASTPLSDWPTGPVLVSLRLGVSGSPHTASLEAQLRPAPTTGEWKKRRFWLVTRGRVLSPGQPLHSEELT
jgi:hypothetical protein